MSPADAMASDFEHNSEHPIKEVPEIDLVDENCVGSANGVSEDWRKALKTVVPAVVVLRITATLAFDTERAGYSSATGFVVDKARGIILTNRHVVKPGPIVAEAMFLNREEIPVHPLYRDPVHDFGFFRYDPKAVQFMEYEEIPLKPEAAVVGLEIRVVGNDSGDQVSILAGTIARLDRDAPSCKRDGYNDFNTFYIQAASGTKGGSSGSPVIDRNGQAVALNAGSRSMSASAFFLPLERVVRALGYVRGSLDGEKSLAGWQSSNIPRGTLQMTLVHKGFDETRRLGVRREVEELVRGISPATETGMLVVSSVVPGGPADKKLEPGDVVVRVNGDVVTQFLRVETLLDDSVSNMIDVEVERGGDPVAVRLQVQDLHSITPDTFLEVSGGVLNSLSYQQARSFRFPCGLVYVAESGYMLARAGVPRHAIIKKMAGKDISKIEDFISVFSSLPRGARVPLEYVTYSDRHRRKSVLVTVDRHQWYSPPQLYSRDDTTGLWNARPAIPPASSETSESNKLRIVPPKSIRVGKSMRVGKSTRVGKSGTETGGVSPALVDSGWVSEEETSDGEAKETSGPIAEPGVANDYDDPEQVDSKAGQEGDLSEDEERGTRRIKDAIPEIGLPEGGEEAFEAITTSVAEHELAPTLVMVEVHIPHSAILDGVICGPMTGTGVIVHHSHDLGLVLVDRNIVSVSVSDIMLMFAAYPIEIPAEVVFLHPVHNFAIIAYNPSELGAAGAAAAKAAILRPDAPLRRGDPVHLVGLTRSLRVKSRKSIVTNPASLISIGANPDWPRYRATNTEVAEIDTDFGTTFCGVLADDDGRVQAFWASFSTQSKRSRRQFTTGMPIPIICDVVEKIANGHPGGPKRLLNGVPKSMPLMRVLEVELYPTFLSKARSFGLSDKWVQTLAKKDPERRQVLRVKACSAESKAYGVLEHADMLLAIGGNPVTCFRDVEDACQSEKNGEGLNLTVFRQGNEIALNVHTDVRDGFGTTRMINWAGSILQETHPAVRALGFLPKEGHGVYVARTYCGSPGHRYGLHSLRWIVEVNGEATPDLDTFVAVLQEIEHGAFVRVKTVNFEGKPRVLTLKLDLHYWPTWELSLDPLAATWCRKPIKSKASE